MAATSRPGLTLGLAALLTLAVPLAGCRGESPCADGGSRCAAASAPAGQRAVRHGYRIVHSRWLHRANKESGQPDIGIQADWAPITERR